MGPSAMILPQAWATPVLALFPKPSPNGVIMLKPLFLAGLLAAGVLGQRSQSLYGQCGGQNWSGPAACPTGAYCKNDGNIWYSQCVAIAGDAGGSSGGGSGSGGAAQGSVVTRTLTTMFSVGGATPTVVTTRITFLTTRPTQATPTPTMTLTPDDPYEEDYAPRL
ncbi:hypothetical protein GQ53DRAFT_852759 [Thozetella sp. PMI_491]|nr:hypothetical protein GQ53DRAFT_852759 [Thozetella sp. PMI_491]